MVSPYLPPVTAAELLRHEFMEPLGIGTEQLAAAIGVPMATLEAILQGQQAIGTDSDAALCEHLGLSQGYWLRAQDYSQSIIDGMATPLSECRSEPGW
jgi:addiction module HigA family antidote